MEQSLSSVSVDTGKSFWSLCTVAWLIPSFTRNVYVVVPLFFIVSHKGVYRIITIAPNYNKIPLKRGILFRIYKFIAQAQQAL